ncbi:hypothetical protein JHK85_045779 [Glycine max]|nr:hypothetical protein JHK85_045779 [Glycine max]
MEEQIITIYTRTNGYLDLLEIRQVRKFLVELRAYLKKNKPQFKEIISSTKTFPREAEVLLKEAIQEQMDLFLLQEHVASVPQRCARLEMANDLMGVKFEDRDLYVTGDLYENDVVTPAMIIVPRRSCVDALVNRAREM